MNMRLFLFSMIFFTACAQSAENNRPIIKGPLSFALVSCGMGLGVGFLDGLIPTAPLFGACLLATNVTCALIVTDGWDTITPAGQEELTDDLIGMHVGSTVGYLAGLVLANV